MIQRFGAAAQALCASIAFGLACSAASPLSQQGPKTEPSAPVAVVSAPPAPPAAASSPALAPPPVATPRTFDLRAASKEHDVRLIMESACPGAAEIDGACAGPAELVVFRKKTGAEVLRVRLEEVWVRLDSSGEPVVDAAAVDDPQGTLRVGDFNFDGREDFALEANHDGPYGGPTYRVFLQRGDSFAPSEDLSRLTTETLGFFQVDAARKRLITFAKDGCCYHRKEELEVRADKPVVVSRFTQDARDGEVLLETEEHLVGGKWTRKTRRVPASE